MITAKASLSTSSPTIESTSLDGARLEIDASNEAVAPQEANAIAKLKIGKLKIGNPRKGIGNAIRKATGGKIGRVPKHIKHEGQKIERPTKMTHLDIE